MTDKPNSEDILSGIAQFLGHQILPALEDRGLSFRLKVALYLMELVQRDQATIGDRTEAEWARLSALLNHETERPSNLEDMQGSVLAMNTELAHRIRDGRYEELIEERAHIIRTLQDALNVVQPRFDQRFDCENTSIDRET